MIKTDVSGKSVNFICNVGGERIAKYVDNERKISYIDRVYQIELGIDVELIDVTRFIGEWLTGKFDSEKKTATFTF